MLGFSSRELVHRTCNACWRRIRERQTNATPSCVWKSAPRIIPHANVHFVYRKIFRTMKYNLIYQAISGSQRFTEIVRRRDGPRNWRPCACYYNVGIYFGDIVNLIIYLYLSMHAYDNKRKITLALYFCDILRFFNSRNI